MVSWSHASLSPYFTLSWFFWPGPEEVVCLENLQIILHFGKLGTLASFWIWKGLAVCGHGRPSFGSVGALHRGRKWDRWSCGPLSLQQSWRSFLFRRWLACWSHRKSSSSTRSWSSYHQPSQYFLQGRDFLAEVSSRSQLLCWAPTSSQG